MRIAIAKPDWGLRGGFELVMDRVAAHLEEAGHAVDWLTVDATQPPHRAFGLDIPEQVWSNAMEYFRYATLLERFAEKVPHGADLVLCTQPASWAVRHPRKLALFYHHMRVFYDLAEPYVAAGFCDPVFHGPCTAEVRSLDAPLLKSVTHFLTPSVEVDHRLAHFNDIGIDGRSPFRASFAFRGAGPAEVHRSDGTGDVLCVSRHEWPKRTELVVAAAHHLRRSGDDVTVRLVGTGGRLAHLRSVDARLQRADADLRSDDGERLWLPAATGQPPGGYTPTPGLHLLGQVDDDELHRLYAGAACLVAPALREDYGLTAIEAMAYGKPVIACRDGGGLAEIVVDEANGLLVEPTGAAIATAVRRLRDEAGLAARLSDGALATASDYSWSRAGADLSEGVERAMA